MLSMLRNVTSVARPALKVASTSQRFATVVDATPVSSSSSTTTTTTRSRTGRKPRLAGGARKNKKNAFIARHDFVVRPPASMQLEGDQEQQRPIRAPRFSAKSSRVRGRRDRPAPQKALSKTEWDEDRGAYEMSNEGEVKVFLPSVFFRLVRNSGREEGDPYTATFRTSTRLNKLDITNYLKNIYGLDVNSIRTVNYANKLRRNNLGGGYSRSGGTKNYKKVVVTMNEPFWYPRERSAEWCNEHFERDRMDAMRDKKMLIIGDGMKYHKQSIRYRGARPPKTDVERQIALETGKATSEVFSASVGDAAVKKPRGLKKLSNVQRSRAEQLDQKRVAIEREMEKLREEGW